MQKYKKRVIAYFNRYLDNEYFKVYVLDAGDYYNVHIISEKFRDEELNTLQLQQPKDSIQNEKEYFNEAYMITQLMDFFIWDRFYNELMEKGLTAYITIGEC